MVYNNIGRVLISIEFKKMYVFQFILLLDKSAHSSLKRFAIINFVKFLNIKKYIQDKYNIENLSKRCILSAQPIHLFNKY